MYPSKSRYVLAALFLLTAATLSMGQNYKPAIDFHSLMEMTFYEQNGGFMVDNLQIVFIPPGLQKGTFIVTKVGGGQVVSVPLRVDQPSLNNFTAFGMFRPDGVPGIFSLSEPGDYVMSVQINGQSATSLPFSLKRDASSDPFNPKTTFTREGPWRDLGFISVRTDDTTSHAQFCWWTSLREIPATAKSRMVTLHLMLGATEVAQTRSPVVVTQSDWQFFRQELVVPGTPVKWMDLPDITKREGSYTLVAKVDGQAFKSYKFDVKGGQIQRLPRNALEFEPHADFISPKHVDVKTSSAYTLRDIYWMTKK